MALYILIIREDLSKYPRPEAELKTIVDAHMGWARELSAKNIFKEGNGIMNEGKLLEMKNGEVVATAHQSSAGPVDSVFLSDLFS